MLTCAKRILLFCMIMSGLPGCGNGQTVTHKPFPAEEKQPPASHENNMTLTGNIICGSYAGNGAQWGGYDEIHRILGHNDLSQDDWNKLFKRIDFMRPGLVRIMVSRGWNYWRNNSYDTSKSDKILIPVLDYCQRAGINVIFGEWGHEGGETIDETWLGMAVGFLDYLISEKGYSCIRYYNMVNEPAGSWASTKENYALWKTLIDKTYAAMEERGLSAKVQLLGPDAAVWTTAHLPWIQNSVRDLDHKLGAYDIHTYPTDDEVHSDFYMSMLRAYMAPVPREKHMLMGELGYKYRAGTTLDVRNKQLISGDAWAGEDSNMMIYYAFYGVDMAAAYIQNMAAGYGGVVAWDMDDAMYHSTDGGFKRWGFWNILGEEMDNPQDEEIRPWFYPVSLLCRYFPAGCSILDVEWAAPRPRTYAIGAMKDGGYTIAVCNAGAEAQTVNLKMSEGRLLKNASIYGYVADRGFSTGFAGDTDADGLPLPAGNKTIDLTAGKQYTFEVPAGSVIVVTTMK